MQKTFKILIVVCIASIMLFSNICAISAANIEDVYDYVATYEIALNDINLDKNSKFINDDLVAVIGVYNDRGKEVYNLTTNAKTYEEKLLATKALNSFMESGSAEMETVKVLFRNQEYYGNETTTASTYGNGQYAMGYTWARYICGRGAFGGGYDSCWGGQSATWNLGNSVAHYIKLNQSAKINVLNANVALSISWPPALTIDSSSSNSSVASWSSEVIYDTTGIGAQHENVSIYPADIGNGSISDFTYTDSGDIMYANTIYKPTTSVKFTVGK